MKLEMALSFMILASAAYASPVLFDNTPVDDSFFGKGAINFYVNITSPDLDTGNVRLYVISEDAYMNNETWDTYSMQCASYAADNWRCSRTVSFSIAGTDTLEYFYFQANDSSGTDTLGSPVQPLGFKIDRTPPDVMFNAPKNNSFIAGNAILNVTIVDEVSGVNNSLVFYSFDSSWAPLVGGVAYINTLAYLDNQTLNIRINTTDNVGNLGISSVYARVDNEKPVLSVVSPLPGSGLKGIEQLLVNITDKFSGLNASNVTYEISGQKYYMSCNGVCNATLDTSSFADGDYSIKFEAYDIVENYNYTTLAIKIKNSIPSVTISPEGYSRQNVTISAAVYNPGGVVSGVVLRIEKGPLSLTSGMSCNGDFTSCTYSFTAPFGDGTYSLNASALNNAGYQITDSAALTIDSIQPVITIETLDIISNTLTSNVRVNDTGNDRNNVKFTLLGNSYPMTCVPQDTTLLCYIDYDISGISDGYYNATIVATDLAGNPASRVRQIVVDKDPPVMKSLKIEPLNPRFSTGVIMTVDAEDKGSRVASASANVKYGTLTYDIHLSPLNSTAWEEKFLPGKYGAYEVEIVLIDAIGNRKTYPKAGYFFLGELSCGDGICQDGENYCLCKSDCGPPKCGSAENIECGSGLPVCRGSGYCGNGVCDYEESCGICTSDCGFCQNESEILPGLSGVSDFAVSQPHVFITGAVVLILAIIVLFAYKSRSRDVF